MRKRNVIEPASALLAKVMTTEKEYQQALFEEEQAENTVTECRKRNALSKDNCAGCLKKHNCDVVKNQWRILTRNAGLECEYGMLMADNAKTLMWGLRLLVNQEEL